MGALACSSCHALGSEFDAVCASCGAPMPAMSVEFESVRPLAFADRWIGHMIGGYRVLTHLGSGGMGVVYQAQARGSGELVAVKLLAPELAGSATAAARFAQEAQSAAQIRGEHAVRILDHGVWEGLPFIVMELLQGEDLGARLERVGRLAPAETVALVNQAARALDQAHAAGVIHRDLKPENVFLAREGQREVVKLLDFGIAKLRGTTPAPAAKTRTGELLGTPSYMSPEQADGTRPVDHRTDLWSLAVIAYRCVTGKLPFESQALGDLLMRIMSYPLPSPLAIDPLLPRRFDIWWSRGASRDPAARFQNAMEMASSLEEALLSSAPALAETQGLSIERERDDEEENRTLLQKPVPFLGRARELDTLLAMVEESEATPVAQAALVVGVAGIGKSRLRQELLAALASRARAPAVWIARGDAMSAGSPFGMMSRALRRQASILDGEPLEVQRAKLGARFGLALREADRGRILAFLGELCSVPFPGSAGVELAAARESPRLMGDQIQRAFEDLVIAEHADRPLVLVLEDLHWGDRPTIDLIGHLLRNYPEIPLFVLALGRPEVTTSFPDLWFGRRLATLQLGDLLARHAGALVRSALGASIDDVALAQLVERAAGNAFFVHELVRAFAEGDQNAVPETVLAMVGERIDRLDPAVLRVLCAASVLGPTFWVEGVRALLGAEASADEVDLALVACERRELLVRRRMSRLAGCTEVAFRHALMSDAALARVPKGVRAHWHLCAAEWLARAGEHDMAVMGEHFERGGDAPRAAAAYRRAAEQLAESNDFTAAIALAERAVAANAEGESLGIVRGIQAEAHGFRDEHTETATRGEEAMALLESGSVAWCAAAVHVARASGSLRDLPRLEAIATAVCALDSPKPRPHHVSCAARIASHLWASDQAPAAEQLLAKAEQLALHASAASSTALAWLHHARAWGAFAVGDSAESLRCEEQAIASFERTGDERNACYIRVGLGHAYREIGALPEAATTLRDALRAAVRLGVPNVVLGAKYTLTAVLFLQGEHSEALTIARDALAGFLTQRDAQRIALARIELARILAESGDPGAAEVEADDAQRALEGAPLGQAFALGVLARARILAKKPAEALVSARSAMQIVTTRGGIPEGELTVRLALADALEAAGDPEAQAVFAGARAYVLSRAASIADATLRARFLEGLPENRRVLALTDEPSQRTPD